MLRLISIRYKAQINIVEKQLPEGLWAQVYLQLKILKWQLRCRPHNIGASRTTPCNASRSQEDPGIIYKVSALSVSSL